LGIFTARQAEFSINDGLQSELAQACVWYHAVSVAMFNKSDRPSIVLLSVNAGIPLASLIAVLALIERHMILT
jgi:hypothetical protein